MPKTELERAEERYRQAKAKLQAIKDREATKQRKLDTRRKVILGAALIDLAARDDSAATLLNRLIRNLNCDQDRHAFEGWNQPRNVAPPVPEANNPSQWTPEAPGPRPSFGL